MHVLECLKEQFADTLINPVRAWTLTIVDPIFLAQLRTTPNSGIKGITPFIFLIEL